MCCLPSPLPLFLSSHGIFRFDLSNAPLSASVFTVSRSRGGRGEGEEEEEEEEGRQVCGGGARRSLLHVHVRRPVRRHKQRRDRE